MYYTYYIILCIILHYVLFHPGQAMSRMMEPTLTLGMGCLEAGRGWGRGRAARGARVTEGGGGDAAVRCACAHARTTHHTEGKTARRGRRRRRQQRARGARDGGAEQRPLARSLLRL